MYSQIGGIVPKLGVKAGLLLKIISSFDALFSKFNCLPKPVNCLPVSFGRLFYRIFTPGEELLLKDAHYEVYYACHIFKS